MSIINIDAVTLDRLQDVAYLMDVDIETALERIIIDAYSKRKQAKTPLISTLIISNRLKNLIKFNHPLMECSGKSSDIRTSYDKITLLDIARVPLKEILRWRNMGKVTLKELEELLAQYNLKMQ